MSYTGQMFGVAAGSGFGRLSSQEDEILGHRGNIGQLLGGGFDDDEGQDYRGKDRLDHQLWLESLI